MISFGWSIVIVTVVVLIVFGLNVWQAYQKGKRMNHEKQEEIICPICGEPMKLIRKGLWLCVEHTLYYFRGEYYTHEAWKEMQEKMQYENRKNYHTRLVDEYDETKTFLN